LTAVINALWMSTSDLVEFFRNPVRSESSSELRNPVGLRSWNRIMFNTVWFWFDSDKWPCNAWVETDAGSSCDWPYNYSPWTSTSRVDEVQ